MVDLCFLDIRGSLVSKGLCSGNWGRRQFRSPDPERGGPDQRPQFFYGKPQCLRSFRGERHPRAGVKGKSLRTSNHHLCQFGDMFPAAVGDIPMQECVRNLILGPSEAVTPAPGFATATSVADQRDASFLTANSYAASGRIALPGHATSPSAVRPIMRRSLELAPSLFGLER